MRIDVVSIFPDYLAPLRLSLVGKAVAAGTIDLRVHDLRTFTHDRHNTVDDNIAIPFLAPERDALLEYELVRLISQLDDPSPPKIAVISSLLAYQADPSEPGAAFILREAKRAGVAPFCISIDHAANDYLRRMCLPQQYLVLPDVHELPEQLVKVYRALTSG